MMSVAGDLMTTDSDLAIAQEWLRDFCTALEQGDARAAADLFLADGWWRDLLAFTWDLRTLHGVAAIATTLEGVLPTTGPSAFSLEPGKMLPQVEGSPGKRCVQAFFVFETRIARGRGILRLVPDQEGSWKAWTLLTAMEGLKGFEEPRGPRRPLGVEYGIRRGRESWLDRRVRSEEYRDREPQVVVIGAGQAGLAVAARLSQLGVDTLIVERHERVGDNWRKRYHTLVLHDPVWFDHLPYLPFPDNWPVFTPKDKLADWLEHYASTMELNIWTSTEFLDADYDSSVETWTVRVRRGNNSVHTLHPRHVILATGMAGVPYIPEIEGKGDFRGVLVHSSAYTGAAGWAGKKAVVIGTGTSGHDIAHDFYEYGAHTTLIQRSSTYVLNSTTFTRMIFAGTYQEGGPSTEDADLISASTPNLLAEELSRDVTARIAEVDNELLRGLEAAGFKLNCGVNGGGISSLYLHRGGGYYINVGASELIAEGKIALKQGAEITRFTLGGIEFADGTVLEADTVVLATGYQNMRESARRILGDEVVDRVRPVWGLDDEGELRTIWRDSEFPHFWFMGGNLQQCRYFSKFLALQIKAIEEGLRRL